MPFAKGMTLNNDNNDIITEPIFVTTKYAYTVTNDNMEEPDRVSLKIMLLVFPAATDILERANQILLLTQHITLSLILIIVYGNNYTLYFLILLTLILTLNLHQLFQLRSISILQLG